MIQCLSRRHMMCYQFYIFLNILLVLFPVNYCIVPQAIQEDLLHSLKSYSDVTMFHYTVPKEVLRATWQFAAFMDEPTCQPRKVYIHLQFGSYPIIPINNGTFPTNMYVQRNQTVIVNTTTSYEPRTVTIVPIYAPQPGDWFVGAYMPYWDERIQQQGLGHKCQYSIGTVALWTQVDNIENIPIGYQNILRTSATTTYYKIYIPSGIWKFRLSIWNCNFTLHTIHDIHEEFCIKALSLKGRALPVYNQSHSVKTTRLTTHDSYTFIESSPYEDSYYYLLIVSNSIIEFNVKVDILECPIKVIEKSFMRPYNDPAQILNSVTEVHTSKELIHELYKDKSNISKVYNKYKFYKDQFYQRNEQYDDEIPCTPRHQLVRVKHAEPFSTVYLLQGNEWLSARVILSKSVPVMTQFNILPLIDIGGTLEISAQLEIDKISPMQLVVVTMCIQKGHIPKLKKDLSCRNEMVSMNLSSLNRHNVSLLIPYPQPDTWYIIIHALCYKYSHPVDCASEKIPIMLNVRTKKCVLSDQSPCGYHGTCREIQRNVLSYTTCSCFEGYTGWGCTDSSNIVHAYSSVISTVMLILSNGFFIPAIYTAIKRELYVEGLVYLATMLFSSLYHACDQNEGKYCITNYEVLQYSDFFSSILAFWVTLVAMAQLPHNLISLCHMIGVFIITYGVQTNRTSLINILIPLSMGIFIPVTAFIFPLFILTILDFLKYSIIMKKENQTIAIRQIIIIIYIADISNILTHTYRALRSRKCTKPNGRIFIGLIFAIIGLLLYSFIETKGNYQYVHSMWHIVIAISLIFLLPSRLNDTVSLRSTSLNDNNDSLNWKESYGIPTFIKIAGKANARKL